jgi:inner membrane protein
MLIPAVLVQELIVERKNRQQEVIAEVSNKWAGAQTISGPYLSIPYTFEEKRKNGEMYSEERILTLLPETLNTDGEILPHTKRRSIFEVALYKGSLTLNGHFNINKNLAGIGETIHWERARLCLEVSDIRGIESQAVATLPGKQVPFESGINFSAFPNARGISLPVNLQEITDNTSFDFNIPLQLKGSEFFKMLPLGKTTTLNLKSNWPSPSFTGNFLPEYTLHEKGFHAKWKVLHFNRDFPQIWKNTHFKTEDSSFGLSLIQPADGYAKAERTTKYAILFIGLTFGFFFLLEILLGYKVHPIQYVLTGLALVVFYTFTEVSSFNVAYGLSSFATISLITLYAKSLFKKWKNAFIIGGFLASLYAYIFILLQLEDSSLLAGSIGLFVLIGIAMHLSRKINWYPTPANPVSSSSE